MIALINMCCRAMSREAVETVRSASDAALRLRDAERRREITRVLLSLGSDVSREATTDSRGRPRIAPRESSHGGAIVQRLAAQFTGDHHWMLRDRMATCALRHLKRPLGVANWETRLVERLPKELRGSLPTVEEIEAELGKRPTTRKKKQTRGRNA